MAPAPGLATLLHLVGFGTGAALYALLGVMARGRAGGAEVPAAAPGGVARDDAGRPRDRIPVATAALGLTWNLGALVHYLLGPGGPAVRAAGATAFAALAFLPAVAVHAAVLEWAPAARRRAATAAYTLSAVGAAWLVAGAATGGALPDRRALGLLTAGYAAMLVWLAVGSIRRGAAEGPADAASGVPGAPRERPRAGLTVAALAAFAVTAFHVGHHGAGEAALARESLGAELLGDHASLALVLAILYQDFRFALADRFLTRALTALVLVGAALAVHLLVLAPTAAPRLAADPTDPLGLALQLAAWAAAVLAAPRVHRAAGWLVDRLLLRRADYRALRPAIATAMTRAESPEAVLDAAAAALGPALAAGRVRWTPVTAPDAAAHAPVVVGPGARRATVFVPTVDAPSYQLEIEALEAGRRLLSDDVALLEWVALQAGRRIDAVRVAHERCAREVHEAAIARLATQAELRALRAQLNPHFLFNALTTVGYLVQTAPPRALDALYRLTDLLRAVLRPQVGEHVPLAEELAIVEAYLAVEQARFEERLVVRLDVEEAARGVPVPPLLLQPLVENAVQHGIAPLRRGGTIVVGARLERGGDASAADDAAGDAAGDAGGDAGIDRLRLWVHDTGAGASPDAIAARHAAGGLGLASVRGRLERLYGARASVAWRTAPGAGMQVTLVLPAAPLAVLAAVPPALACRPGGAPDRRAERRVTGAA